MHKTLVIDWLTYVQIISQSSFRRPLRRRRPNAFAYSTLPTCMPRSGPADWARDMQGNDRTKNCNFLIFMCSLYDDSMLIR